MTDLQRFLEANFLWIEPNVYYVERFDLDLVYRPDSDEVDLEIGDTFLIDLAIERLSQLVNLPITAASEPKWTGVCYAVPLNIGLRSDADPNQMELIL